MDSLPESRHLRLEQLADGVYAAIHKDGGWAIANAGIIDLGDQTVIFDTTMTPSAAVDLRHAAEQLTGCPATYVINSHHHNDHIWGNQVFPENTTIIATTRTRELILTKGQAEYTWYRENAPAQLKDWSEQYDAERDEKKRAQLFLWVAYYQGLVESMPTLQVRLPDQTFGERLVLHGANRSAELLTFGDGHTESDAILYLPAEGIVFMADLLFIRCHPYLADGDPQATIRILDQVAAFNPKTVVPGHGPVGTPADLSRMKQYITGVEGMARSMVKAGEPIEQVAAKEIPPPFDSWEQAQFFPVNLRFLYQRLSSM